MRQFLCMSKKLRPEAQLRPAGRLRRLEPPPLHGGQPDPPDRQPGQRLDQRPAAHGRPAARRGPPRAHPVERPGPVLGLGVGLGQQPARPAGRAARRCTRAGSSEALYRMWRAGVSLASWFFLRDGGGQDAKFQSGLYLRCADGIECDRPKLALQAFRFPFVALPAEALRAHLGPDPAQLDHDASRDRARAQGPVGARRLSEGRIRPAASSRAGCAKAKRGRYRARIPGGEASRGFSLKVPAGLPGQPAGRVERKLRIGGTDRHQPQEPSLFARGPLRRGVRSCGRAGARSRISRARERLRGVARAACRPRSRSPASRPPATASGRPPSTTPCAPARPG